jgi:hypothetical protein
MNVTISNISRSFRRDDIPHLPTDPIVYNSEIHSALKISIDAAPEARH